MAAEQAVSILLTRLAPLIEKTVREEVNLLRNADKEAQRLLSKLKKIHQVLEDAELKAARERRDAAFRSDVRVMTDRKVENWLRKLQNITYEIEDVLDKWEVENIKRRLGEESGDDVSSSSKKKKVFPFLESGCLCFKQTIDRRSIAWEIKEINQKLDSIAKEKDNEFDFVPNVGHVCKDFKRNTSTTSFVDVSGVYGRDCDKDSIITKLLAGNEHDHDGVQVVSIVGVGGMGKTTLAQLIFNDSKVQEQFPVRKWICVSEPFDKIKIAKEILGDGNDSSDLSFQRLLERIVESMREKMFLLVLDDVWIEKDEDWRDLKVALTRGAASGSKILVTTRKEKVATTMDGRSIVHLLKPLEEAYCWSILSKIAFHGRTERDCKMLEETGRKIAERCKGLPLAAKTIGGVLHFKTSFEEWQGVLKSDTWELNDVRENVFPLLTLSYDELHPAVKRCFSYCAIFPKDEEIYVDDLIRFWMAQGFLYSTENADDMELIGREYFDDLAMRSLFQDFEKDDVTGRIEYCKMHDMVHDYAQFLTNNECLILDQDHQGGRKASNTEDVRHLNMITKDAVGLDSIHNCERLRSFMCGTHTIAPNLFAHLKKVRFAPNLFAHLKKVRFVHVGDCELQNIPEEIGSLIHLRCLDISGNLKITKLPETICDLYNLQTLCIERCRGLCGLPQNIHKLINLRHYLNDCTYNCKLPKGIEKLTNLRTLSKLNATSKFGDSRLGLLKNLNHLAGNLSIAISGEGWDVEEAKKADLKSKKLIEWLFLYCRNRMNMEVVEALQPHPNLISLNYDGGGGYLPKWITTLTHLKRLVIRNVKMPSPTNLNIGDLFSPLGQLPSIEILEIANVGIKHVGSDFLSRTFPNLRKLSFFWCGNWEEWEDMKGDEEEGNEDAATSTNVGQVMLEELEIYNCPNLKALPNHSLRAKDLQHLRISYCKCLYDRYKSEEGLNELQYIPHKHIIERRW